MILQDHEMPNGWPLGLENMNIRLRVAESSQAAAAEPNSLHMRSASFSSVSSSNLDTESTASFFQDQSMSLGRLIGIRPGCRGDFYCKNTNCFEEDENTSGRGSSGEHGEEMTRGKCVPLLLGILEKMSRSKSNTRR
ncbi:hypothetical protein F0562_018399 [Nyssa sinensis]|uniref:Uncharacterized protein n=1 Tax=Nyssa sinensis TaxID=561372 RepID=A0A5J4Z9X0_9ASTE|nr:hypothetical protein F0562_018399 [Nyssa sinensis]